ncbi:MAG TPA: hypothetical protein VN924_11165 [Bryobacteraceae bacterium]|jgi:hypothetical protein|nr:hypothetical protein [Bryobacteraceae bacterium]
MEHNGRDCGARRTKVTPMDLAQERHRLRESKVHLVLLAEEMGLAVPRSCCLHRGEAACLSCASEWLVSHLRLAKGAAN